MLLAIINYIFLAHIYGYYVDTIAGSSTAGFSDGTGFKASFSNPVGITIAESGNLYVTDQNNHRIRLVTQSGNVSTVAGNLVRPYGITVDQTGVLFVTERNGHRIREISVAGHVSTVAGSESSGYVDGNSTNSRFYSPLGIAIGNDGNLYVTDSNNHCVRKIDKSGNTTTIAGFPAVGFRDGDGTNVRFTRPLGITSDKTGNIYVADMLNCRIRKMSLLGEVTTVAGSGYAGYLDGNAIHFDGMKDEYDIIQNVVYDQSGSFYVAGIYTNTTVISNYLLNQTYTDFPVLGARNGFIAKFAPNGSLVWVILVQGNPLYFGMKASADSPIVVIQYAKQEGDLWACVIFPVTGQPQYYSTINYGSIILQLSPSGGIVWSKQVNFAPWEKDQPLSIANNGVISYTGSCLSTCFLYEGNGSTASISFSGISGDYIGINLRFFMNGTLASWSRLQKFIQINLQSRFRCSFNLRSNITLLSHGVQTDIEIPEQSKLDVVSANSKAFLSSNNKLRFKMDLIELKEVIVDLNPMSITGKSCLVFTSLLGPYDVVGDLETGTYSFTIDPQYGYISVFPITTTPNNTLIRFWPEGRFDFRCGLYNETHVYFFEKRSEYLDISLSKIVPDFVDVFWGDVIEKQTIKLEDASSPMFAFTSINGTITLYLDGYRITELNMVNMKSLIFNTVDTKGFIKMMGIMHLPARFESWLTIATSTIDSIDPSSFSTSVKEKVKTDLVPTPSTNSNPDKTWSFFGLSMPIFFAIIGTSAFVLSFCIVVVIYLVILRKRRRNKFHQNTMMGNMEIGPTFSKDLRGDVGVTKNQTLVNTESSLGPFKFSYLN